MFIEQPPLILRWLYPRAFWRMDKNEKAVYLTFDDGPIPEITPWVLDLLDKYNIKATFFLVGDNVRKHPKEFQMIVERGHRLGNHTFNHIRGFEYRSKNYLERSFWIRRFWMPRKMAIQRPCLGVSDRFPS